MSTQLNCSVNYSRHDSGINNAVGCGLRTVRKELTKCGTTFMPRNIIAERNVKEVVTEKSTSVETTKRKSSLRKPQLPAYLGEVLSEEGLTSESQGRSSGRNTFWSIFDLPLQQERRTDRQISSTPKSALKVLKNLFKQTLFSTPICNQSAIVSTMTATLCRDGRGGIDTGGGHLQHSPPSLTCFHLKTSMETRGLLIRNSLMEFTDEELSNEEFTDKEFTNKEFTDKEFTNKEFTDKEFSYEEFTYEEFADEEFSDEEFTDESLMKKSLMKNSLMKNSLMKSSLIKDFFTYKINRPISYKRECDRTIEIHDNNKSDNR
ncbi:hypothetical protein J6590_032479 [Homalodisca vitripennis]|nr:hypothetical protein J6590_032479 [Homalodisca vitripennis]